MRMTSVVPSPLPLTHRAGNPRLAQTAAASLKRQHPGTSEPGRHVADRLLMATGQACHPLLRCIMMQTDDRALPRRLACAPGRVLLNL